MIRNVLNLHSVETEGSLAMEPPPKRSNGARLGGETRPLSTDRLQRVQTEASTSTWVTGERDGTGTDYHMP